MWWCLLNKKKLMKSKIRQKVKGNRLVDVPCEGEARHIVFEDEDASAIETVCYFLVVILQFRF